MKSAMAIYKQCAKSCSSFECLAGCQEDFAKMTELQVEISQMMPLAGSDLTQYDTCIGQCQNMLDAECVMACQETFTFSLRERVLTDDFRKALTWNNATFFDFLKCVKHAQNETAYEACDAKFNEEWVSFNITNIVNWEAVDRVLDKKFDALNTKLAELMRNAESTYESYFTNNATQKANAFSLHERQRAKRNYVVNHHRQSWRRNLNNRYRSRRYRMARARYNANNAKTFVEFANDELAKVQYNQNISELPECSIFDDCMYECAAYEDFYNQKRCFESGCKCQVSLVEDPATENLCAPQCVSNCVHNATSFSEFETCKNQGCQCEQAFEDLMEELYDELHQTGEEIRAMHLVQLEGVEGQTSSMATKVALIVLLSLIGAAAIIMTYLKVQKANKVQIQEKTVKKQETKEALDTFAVSEPYEKVM